MQDAAQEEMTLDTWKPREKEKTIPKSEWRQQQIAGNYNQQPGLDELHKILGYLKRGYPDFQIMDAFRISSETLVAIKRDCYHPIDGISLDNLSKIYKKFQSIEKKINNYFEAMKILVDMGIFDSKDTVKKMLFKTFIGMRTKKPKKKKEDVDGEE